MTTFFYGAACLIVFAIAVAVRRHIVNSQNTNVLVTSLRTISEVGMTALELVRRRVSPYDSDDFLRWSDVGAIYNNSRIVVRLVYRAMCSEPADTDLKCCFEEALENHRKVSKLLALVAIEKLLGDPSLSLYGRALLWTYASELEILYMVSGKFNYADGEAIRAIC